VSTRIGVVVFPGSNCEHDVVGAVGRLAAEPGASAVEAELVWHTQHALGAYDAVILPGGFAHGDYLRPGALARFSPVMEAVAAYAAAGGPVVGICNGFQVLTEAGLLPGALQKNRGLRFLCTTVAVEVCTTRTVLTAEVAAGAVLEIPVNHFEGNYTCDADTLARLNAEDRVVLRYRHNPNGSIDDIAGVCNEAGNVVGLMPHPERACDPLTGSTDGAGLLRSVMAAATRPSRIPA
jgi:phosphoribosylformylglycinamidine synthase